MINSSVKLFLPVDDDNDVIGVDTDYLEYLLTGYSIWTSLMLLVLEMLIYLWQMSQQLNSKFSLIYAFDS